jgi:hypothetical protein
LPRPDESNATVLPTPLADESARSRFAFGRPIERCGLLADQLARAA